MSLTTTCDYCGGQITDDQARVTVHVALAGQQPRQFDYHDQTVACAQSVLTGLTGLRGAPVAVK